MPNLDGSKSMAAIHIRSAIEALLSAHSSASMFRSDGHTTYIENVPANLDAALRSIQAAQQDVENFTSSREDQDDG